MIRTARLAFQCAARPLGGDRLVWERDGVDWPNRTASRFVRAGGIVWHVQQMGQGPVLFLLHGTGSSTHSWRGLAPLLARRFTVVAPDLPGHGFTTMPGPDRLSLPGMAGALAELLKALDVLPALAVGHSAGAAILARMCLDGQIAPQALVSLNGAFLPLRGAPAHLFSPIAKLLALLPPASLFFGRLAANPGVVERLIDNTGSRLDSAGIEFYRRLFSNPGHVSGTLGMMANWRLEPIARDLGRLKPSLVLAVGGRDRTISPDEAIRVRTLISKAVVTSFPGLGHLAHEEAPEKIAALIEHSIEVPRRRKRS